MNIRISPFISTRVYKLKDNTEIGYILDEKHHEFYLIKNDIAYLWNIICSEKNYQNVLKFAQQKKLEEKLIFFLTELKNKKFINFDYDFDFKNTDYKILFPAINIFDDKANIFLEKIWRNILYQQNLLGTLSLQLSYKCNEKCKHCFNPKNKFKEELNFEICKKAIDEAYNLGITEVGITGGECTIHQDFLKIARYIREKHLSLFFLTNGQKLYDDNSFFSEIINLYPRQIIISLYSMHPEIHDNITGIKGSWVKTIQVIKSLREKNIDVAINSILLSLNKDSYIEIKKFTETYNCKFHNQVIFFNNKNNDNEYAKISKEDIEKYYINLIKENGDIRPRFVKNNQCITNPPGITLLNIAPNLDIKPCNDFDYILGNYKTFSLAQIVKNIFPKYRLNCSKENLEECFNQKYCQYCNYSVIASVMESGFLKKVKTCCEDAEAYYNALNKVKKVKK